MKNRKNTMSNISTTNKFLIRLAGYDLETAESCSKFEQNKLAMHGTLVGIPALIGFFAMGYAIFLFSNSKVAAIIGGLLWSTIILNLDRAILNSGKSKGITLGMMGRFFLALVVGIVVAEPAVMFIFEDSIDQALYRERMHKKEMIDRKYAPKYLALNQKVEKAQEELKVLQNRYTLEMDGKGSDKGVGRGPIFEQKYADYQIALQNYKDLKLDVIKKKENLRREHLLEIGNMSKVQAKGLAGRFDTLHNIDSSAVKVGVWALRLLFFFIELIPFLIKLSKNQDEGYWEMGSLVNKNTLKVFKENSAHRNKLFKMQDQALYKERMYDLVEKNSNMEVEHYNNRATFSMNQSLKAVDLLINKELEATEKYKENGELLHKVLNDLATHFERLREDINKSANSSPSQYKTA